MLSPGVGAGEEARSKADLPWLSRDLCSDGNGGKDNKQANGKCRTLAPGSESPPHHLMGFSAAVTSFLIPGPHTQVSAALDSASPDIAHLNCHW